MMRIEVKFGAAKHDVEVAQDATLGALKTAIYDATNVLPPLQKLLGKPNLQSKPDDTPLATLGIKDKTKLMLIGSAAAEVVKANAPSGEEKKKEEERERRLRNLPHSFWRLPAFGGFLADPYVAGRGEPLEGGTALLSLLCMDVILCRLNTLGAGSRPHPSAASTKLLQALGQKGAAEVSHPFLQDISAGLRTAIQRAHAAIRGCYDFTVEASKAVQPDSVLDVMDRCVHRISSLPTGEWLMIPSGWIGTRSYNLAFLLVHCRAADVYDFAVVNRGAEGQEYHPRWQTAEKILSCPVLYFHDVSSTRLLDKTFWLLLLSLWMRRNDPQNQSEFIRAEVFYDVMLPWLVEKLPAGRRIEDDSHSTTSCPAGCPHLTTARFTTEMILHMTGGNGAGGGGGADNEQEAPFSRFVYDHAASPTCSSSSGIKSVITAFCFLLEQYYPALTAAERKRIKYVLKYEFFIRAAEDLSRYSRRFLTNSLPTVTTGPPAASAAAAAATAAAPADSVVRDRELRAALDRLKAAGVNDTAANLSLSSVWLNLTDKRVYIKDKQNKILPDTDFRDRMMLLFVGCLKVPGGKETSAMLAEAVTAMKARCGPGAVEVIFLSCDETQEDYEEHCTLFDFPRATYPCFEVLNSMELAKVPELLVFHRDGELLHRHGMSALRADPEAAQFPDGPWKGAVPLSATDVQLLRVGASQLAHHTKKRLDRGQAPVAGNDTVVQHVVELLHAVEAVVAALPRDDVQEMIHATSEVRSRTTASGPNFTTAAAAASQAQPTVDTMVQEPIDAARDGVFQNAELLPKVSVANYYGPAFQSAVPSLPEIHDLARATTYAELYTLLPRVRTVVDTLWRRAGNSGTASRVAVQLHIIEFITWTFSTLVPVPLPPGCSVDSVPQEEQWCVASFYDEDTLPPAPQQPAGEGAAAAAPAPDPHAADPQLVMLECVYYLMLSLANAWQAVETPTRSFDAERCLISVDMLLVFDAVLRQLKGGNKCRLISTLLSSGAGGGYYPSTTQGKHNVPFSSLAATLQLTRPQLLPIRSAVLRYIDAQQAAMSDRELFDLRMPDKLELFKSSHTVEFLKATLANAGYSLEQSGGLFGGGSSEMDKLMEWLCSYRSPLAKEHPAFGMMRDMTLLAKFMGTMEMRDAQLLHRRKELDALASWRISFEEDAPGRQMSAGWRTRPAPPRWECLMVRGRDMDIADIAVKGFGDREVMYGEGLALHSPIDVSRMIEVDHPTEDDVLHAKALPTFAGTMNVEESEVLLSCLTAPYVRIPLVLDFFASQDRHTYLFVHEVQEVLRAVLFEPAAYASPELLAQADPRSVPMRLSKEQREAVELRRLRGDLSQQNYENCLGTTYGLLLSELTHAPTSVLRPLRSLLESITELGPSSVYSSNASYVLFVVGVLCDVLAFCRFVAHHHHERLHAAAQGTDAGRTGQEEQQGQQRDEGDRQRRQAALAVMEEYHHSFLDFFVATVQPLLWAWLEESEENTDTPTQCVIHAHMSRVDRALWKGHETMQGSGPRRSSVRHSAAPVTTFAAAGRLTSGGAASTAAETEAHLVRMLQSYAFVRARHGFGMGMQRSQLAAQEGDNLLTPEEKMLRFLQAQGLDTSRVSKEMLEQGKQLMMSGGRRRAVFVQIRSRNYNDTVRVPNLIHSDPSSTTESKLLKLPPADVPENVLFSDLLEDHGRITAFLDAMTPQQRGGVFLSVVQAVLRDHAEGDGAPEKPGTPHDRKRLRRRSRSTSVSTRASAVNLDAIGGDGEDDEGQAQASVAPAPVSAPAWSVSSPGVYKGPAASGLLFHAQTCELFWRNDELKPVPDSMSHFTDFENILGKDALQCGLVSRHEHRHWVHLVGTPYDVIEWTAPPDPADQGAHHPFIISGNWPAESAEGALFQHVTYDRIVAVEDDNPWPHKEERWAVDMLRDILRTAYPSGLKFYPLAPALTPADPSSANEEEERLVVPQLHHYEMRFLMNDAPQYENEDERATWKEVVAYRYPQPRIELYNLVPHARKLYRSLVYSTNQHYCLHSMALLTGARTRESLAVTAFQAGELKRRIFNESTLEIHRYNEAIRGREVYIPARLLQGLIPSVLLESFFLWQGEDDVLRGYPLSEENDAASVLQDAAAAASKRKPARAEVMDHWFNYSIEIHLHVGRGGARGGSSPDTEGAVSTVPACVVVRRNDKGHSAVVEATRGCPAGDGAAAAAAAVKTVADAQGAAHRLMLQRATSADGLADLSGDALHGHDEEEEARDGVRITEADVALLHEALSHLPTGVCVRLLREAHGDIASALTWASSSTNTSALLEMVEHDAKAGGEGGGSANEKRRLAQMVAKTRHAVDTCDYVLVNLLHCRHLSSLLQMLTRIEDCSHILVWGRRCTGGGGAADEEGAASAMALRVPDTTTAAAGRGYVQIEVIEMPRLRVRFYTSTDGASSRVRLFLADQPGWRLAEWDDFHEARWRQLRKLQAPFQQCLLLCNSTNEVAFLCPNHDFAPMKIDGDPFNPMLLFDRSSYTWREAVPSPFYVYVVHSSSSFVTPPSLSASLYYAVMQCATQHYAGAMRTLESCYTDSGFSTEEGFMFALFERTLADRFPDACAVRLKLAHAVQYSTNTYQWPLAAELSSYLTTKHHVAEDCRLLRGEVLDLLKRSAQAVPMVRSQLELYAGLLKHQQQQAAAASAATSVPVVVLTPAMERCRFPWERLLLYPWERIAPQKLKRVSYQLQSPELVQDEKLVEFLWTDQLLMDEEGGANTKRGFYFLYCMKHNTVVPKLGPDHVGATLSQLLSRWFQLRHARWGREAQQGSETELAPSWCATVLQLMEMFPHADWPAPADNAERYILARGVPLTEEYETQDPFHVTLVGDQQAAARRRRGTIPDIFNGIHRVAQEHFRGEHVTEAVREARQMSRLRTPDCQKTTVAMFDHLRGRVTPGNTSRAEVELRESDIAADYFKEANATEAAAAAARRASLHALCTEPLGSLQLAGSIIGESPAADSAPGGQSSSTPTPSAEAAVLPFDLRTHPLSRTPLAQNMLDRLEEDSMRFRNQETAQRPHFFHCLSREAVRHLLTTPDAAAMTASLAGAVQVLGECVQRLHALGAQDADRVMRLRASVLTLANAVHPLAAAASLDHGRLVHHLQRAERSRVAVPLEWLCAGLLSTTLEADLNAENLFHGSLPRLEAELILLMLLSNRMYFAEQAAQAVQQLLLFLELCGLLRGVSPPRAGKAAAPSPSGAPARATRIRELVQHFSLEIDPVVLLQLTSTATTPAGASGTEADAKHDEEVQAAGSTHLHTLSEETCRTVSGRLQQLASTALDILTARRTYVHLKTDAAAAAATAPFRATLDPRFLVFEFLFNILLRARQVEMVEWFVRNIREGQSRVQQMIMGQGKTTVVGPLLALILADGRQLVTQVMPTALLEQTRGILRRCFGVVVTKHIYTVQFDRSNEDGTSDGVELLFQKLKSAEEDRSVVIAAPECVKSVFLKSVEQLHMIESVPTEDMELDETADDRYAMHIKALRRKMVERSALADAITPILELWKRGVLIMDEVDVLLHPLRSELNFPIGLKHPIDMSGPRWLLPIHLLDGIFANQQGRACEDVQQQLKYGSSSSTAMAHAAARDGGGAFAEARDIAGEKRRHAISAIRSVILNGFRQRALQREPHLVLLDPGHYYVDQLLPALVPWLQLWLHEHLIDHLPEQERQHWVYAAADVFAEKTKSFLLSPVKRDAADSAVTRELNACMPHYGVQLLNLAHDWLHRLLPHVLAKIDRVSFGVLQPNDLALSGDAARMPYSRKMMAVPFIAKDVPSRSSEFAHPDVVIGLTILAFRYEGLRVQDVKELVTQLKQDFARQAGPKEHRPAAKLYKHWLRLSSADRATGAKKAELAASSAGAASGAAKEKSAASGAEDSEDVLRSFERAGVPLSQLQVTDKAQMQSLYHLLHRVPEVIHYYLCSTIFPRTMNFQRLKISACGHELGSSMLFTKRIGFSGTPSNLLPLDLGECFYEPGSDGRVLSVLTNREVAHAEVLPDSWTPLRLLDRIAAAQPPYAALIDAGALITNMDNEEVARYLLTRLPATLFDGVVFLDRRDRQMILQRDNGLVVPVSQCGVPLARRFTFFDQVHTTGTDVKQSSTAVAVITFGKDLVFRDYAQGAYRMRGIGKGQRLCLYLIPEVVSRIHEALGAGYRTGDMLRDVPAWLLLNSMKIEGLQFFKLSLQELANVWRKKAIAHLLRDAQHANAHPELFTGWMRCRRFHLTRRLSSTADHPHANEEAATSAAASSGVSAPTPLPSVELLRAAIAEFREVIEYPVAGTIAQAPSFSEHLQDILQARPQALIEEDAVSQGFVEQLLDRMRRSIQASRQATATAGSGAGTGPQQSQQEGGQAAAASDGDGVHDTMDLNAEIVHEQEAEEEQEQEAEQEEQRVSAYSRDDESQIAWAVDTLRSCGTLAADTVRPTHGCCFYQMNSFQIRPSQPLLQVSPHLLVSDNYFRLDWHGVGERRLKNVFLFVEWVPSRSSTATAAAEDADAVCSGLVTLAEGESLRWMVHHSRHAQTHLRFALRFASNGAYMDATGPFAAVVHRQGVRALHHMPQPSPSPSSAAVAAAAAASATAFTVAAASVAGAGAEDYDGSGPCDAIADRAVLLYRFLNSDMFYSAKQLAVLEEVLAAVSPSGRLHFFTECLRVRRRSRNQWEDAPIAALFVSDAERPYLRQLAVGKRMQQGIEDLAELLVRATLPKVSNRVRREAEPVQQSFDAFALALSQAVSASDRGGSGAAAAQSCAAGRVAEMLTETFPTVFKTLSVEEVEKALLFLVLQRKQQTATSSGDAGMGGGRGAGAAEVRLSPTAFMAPEERQVTLEEVFGVLPCLNAETLHARVATAQAPRAAAKNTGAAAAAASTAALPADWSCEACTFHNPMSSNMCEMCMAAKPRHVRESEDAATAAALAGGGDSAGAGAHAGHGGNGDEDDEEDDDVDMPWQCEVCTFINDSRAQGMCEVCMAPNPRPLRAAGGGGGGGAAGTDPFGGGFECPEGYWVCSVEHGGCSKFNPNAVFYCQVCEKARPNLASLRF